MMKKTAYRALRRVLPLCLALALLLCVCVPARASSLSLQESTLYRLLSEDRAAYGLHALTLDPELCRMARIRCQDMLENNYCGHLSPTYGTVRDLLTRYGVAYQYATENVGRSRDVAHSNAAFLSSPAHRRNVLTTTYTRVGIGVSVMPGGFVYVCEIFAR